MIPDNVQACFREIADAFERHPVPIADAVDILLFLAAGAICDANEDGPLTVEDEIAVLDTFRSAYAAHQTGGAINKFKLN